jgi:hypothetical protein
MPRKPLGDEPMTNAAGSGPPAGPRRGRRDAGPVAQAAIATLSTEIGKAAAEIETAREQLQAFVSALTF